MIEIRRAALLTRQLNLHRLTNLAVAVFGEGLLKKNQRGALTNREKAGERDEGPVRKWSILEGAKMFDWAD